MTEFRRPGLFITFEGPDGSGKTTQMNILAQRLRELRYEVIETQEPGGTDIGRQIRRILLDSSNKAMCPTAEMLLYFAARAQNFDEVILPAWDRGAIVLSDRFTDSTLAYQGEGRALGQDTVVTLHDIACHGLQPDLSVVIDIDPETALERSRDRQPDRLESESAAFHARVREAYFKLAAAHPKRIRIVEGGGPVEDVFARMWAVVAPVLKSRNV
jgi:dTMP kinase